MDIPIVFENNDFLVIDKPTGLTVNKAESTKGQDTVQDWIGPREGAGTCLPAGREFYEKSGIVHRLDKDTSGLLIIAKNLKSYLELKSQFQNRTVVKKYLTLVHGIVEPAVGIINAPIERNPMNRTKFGVFVGGREAETSYKLLKILKVPKLLSLLEITPKTGRTHQIRVHMKYINHPVVSDPIYGGRKQYKEDLKFCPRLFLHASHLEISGLTFDSPLPPDLQKVIQ